VWGLLAAVVLGAALRFFRIGHQSLWVDEILTLQASEVGGTLTPVALFRNTQGPLHAFLVHVLSKMSTAEWVLRSLSAAFGVAAIPIAYLLGRETADRATGVLAAFILALSPFAIWYSQEVRNYALLIFFAGLSTWLLARVLNGRGRPWPAYGISIYLAVLCNLSAVFLVAGHLVAVIWRARERRDLLPKWILVVVLVAAACGPWIWGLGVWVSEDGVAERVTVAPMAEDSALLRGATTFTPAAVPYALYTLSYGYSLGPTAAELHTGSPSDAFRHHAPLVAPAALVAAALVLPGVGALLRRRTSLILLGAVILLPLVGAVAMGVLNIKPFNPRYVSAIIPVLAVLGAGGARALGRRFGTLLLGLFALFCVLSFTNYAFRPGYWREDVRSAAAHVEARERPGDTVLAPVVADVFAHYFDGDSPGFLLYPGQAGSDGEVAARIEAGIAGRERLWHVSARPWHADPDGRIPFYLDSRFERVEVAEYPGVRVTLYDLGVGETPAE